MEEIFDTNDSFDFSKLTLSNPTAMNGGTFFIRYLINNTHLYIQPPKCSTKQGIMKSGKKFYTDLIFTNENENFIRWMENLESYSQKYIYNNRHLWFDGEMEIHDIENYFTTVLKVYKSGKYYSVRANIQTVLGKPILKIYDENENDVEYDTLTDKTNVMSILEISGIKCSSRSFQIEIELKQMLTLKPSNLFDKILLKEKTGSTGVAVTATSAAISIKEPEPEIIQHDNNLLFEEAIAQTETIPPISDSPPIIPHDENKLDNNIVLKNNLEKFYGEIKEVDFPLDDLTETETVHIKQRNEIYYNMYREARKKAKIAREFALSAYLEAKNIKNTYSLEDNDESDESDLEFDNTEK